MKVVTPGQAARHTGSKYLGVLVAAKLARSLNELRRGELMEDPTLTGGEPKEKLTTTALEEVRAGTVDFRLGKRRRPEGL
jgi:DNA-directed RNA polymerase omega subunit